MLAVERNMSENMGDKFNPAHPSQRDPLEVRIVNLIEKELLSTPWANEAFLKAKGITVDYFKDSIANLSDVKKIHDGTQKVLKDLANTFKARIVSGEENLNDYPKGKAGFIIANHLGSYKPLGIRPEELGLDLPVDVIHPFVMFYQALSPVADKVGGKLYEAAYPYEEPIRTIQRDAGSLLIPSGKGVFEQVMQESERVTQAHPDGLFTIFPEGGTSGKRNNGGPYALEHFHAGPFVVAAKLGLSILPVVQYFNPEKGFELGVFKPFSLDSNATHGEFKKVAAQNQQQMQEWLNQRQAMNKTS